jgi:MscS family membrane protein
MFDNIYYGNSLKTWLIGLTILVAAIVLNKIITLTNKHLIQRITKKTKNRLDDILFKMLEAPVLLAVIILAIWLAAKQLALEKNVTNILENTYTFLIITNITWFVVRFVSALIEEYLVPLAEDPTNKKFDNTLLPIIRRSILGIIWMLGIMMALHNIGVDVAALIAGLGIGGLAFALAAQDTIKNILGGITIYTDRPFRIGDRIVVDGKDGFVEDIGIRSTRLRTLERRLITIPNYKIVEASVENISDEPMRRVLSVLGLTYDTTPEKMNHAIEILKSLPEIISEIDTEIYVAFTKFSDFSLDITFIFWIRKGEDILQTMSKVNLKTLELFNAAGLNFAFPTRTVHMEKESS